jgi:hypothetical protein
LGLVGVENKSCVELSQEDMTGVHADVTDRLYEIGLVGEPKLHIQLFPDF